MRILSKTLTDIFSKKTSVVSKPIVASALFVGSGMLAGLKKDTFEKEECSVFEVASTQKLTVKEKKVYEKIKKDIPEDFEIKDFKQFISMVQKDKKSVVTLMNVPFEEGCDFTQDGISEVLKLKRKEKNFLLKEILNKYSIVDEKTIIDAVKNAKTKKEKNFLKSLFVMNKKFKFPFENDNLKYVLQSLNSELKKDFMLNYVNTRSSRFFEESFNQDEFVTVLKKCENEEITKSVIKTLE